MDIYKQIEAEIFLRNNSPVADFENLSPTNFHYIIHDTYNENSPVRFRQVIDNETLDKVGLFRVAEDFINIIHRDKFIKLTPLGALPKKVMVELYSKKYIFDYMIEKGITKLWKEEDCIAIVSVKLVTGLAGITKKANGKMTLTKKGISFLNPENRQLFFETFIKAFADKFNWGYHDLYPSAPVGQIGWTFSIFLLHLYGDTFRTQHFYAEKYWKALPNFLKDFHGVKYMPPIEQYANCYSVRTFSRFLEWFGLVEMERTSSISIIFRYNIKASPILKKIFSIDY